MQRDKMIGRFLLAKKQAIAINQGRFSTDIKNTDIKLVNNEPAKKAQVR